MYFGKKLVLEKKDLCENKRERFFTELFASERKQTAPLADENQRFSPPYLENRLEMRISYDTWCFN